MARLFSDTAKYEINIRITDVVFSYNGESRYSLMSSVSYLCCNSKNKHMWFGEEEVI